MDLNLFIQPFPHTRYKKRTADCFENVLAKKESILMNYYLLNTVETLSQKVKLLIMSNFSFCHNVFKSRLPLNCQHGSAGFNGLIDYYSTKLARSWPLWKDIFYFTADIF